MTADDLTLGHGLADTADAISMRYFSEHRFRAETKPDGSPVAEADRLVEAAVRAQLARLRPGDAFVGEESGVHGGGGPRWLVDPIDGTRRFLAGHPDWRTLIAVEYDGLVTVGLVSVPALKQRWWAARGAGAWMQVGVDEPGRLAVADTGRLADATFAMWPPAARLPPPLRGPAVRLVASCAAPRSPQGPAAQVSLGALLVASAQLDVFLLAGVGPWDLAAVVPIVEEAGGRFSDVRGGQALDAGPALFTNGRLHSQVLGYFTGQDH